MSRLESRPSPCSTTLTIVTSALLGIGVVMVFSASASLTSPPGTEGVWQSLSLRQALFSGVGLVIVLVVGLCPHGLWRIGTSTDRHSLRKGLPMPFQPAVVLMILTVVLLAAVLVLGEERNGAKRWLSLGSATSGWSFQPSEIAKLAVVVFIAAYCGLLGRRIRRFWSGLLPAALILVLVVGLVGVEDFGTGVLLLAVGACILLAGGARIWHLLILSLPALAGLANLVVSQPYRVQRILAFLDPYADPQGSGYHPIQSLITIASGGWWGRGLGAGIQKYGYLPEGRCDFIFAVICEELGLIGGAAVIGLFAILLWQGRRAMTAAPTDFGRLLALGATLMIGLQAVLHIAVVTVSLPTKGIGLPFVSAGGTGMVLLSTLAGLLVNVARDRRPVPAAGREDAGHRPAPVREEETATLEPIADR